MKRTSLLLRRNSNPTKRREHLRPGWKLPHSGELQCSVLSEQSVAHHFVRGLAPSTNAAVSETVPRLPGHQKTDLPTIRPIVTTEGTTYRAQRGLPLPNLKPAGKAGRIAKSAAKSSLASALHIGEGEWQAEPVLITQGAGPVGERPPTPVALGTTGGYATAFAYTPRVARGTDPCVAELDITNRNTGGGAPCVPLLTNEEAGHAASCASTDGSAYLCWLYRTYGHAMPDPVARTTYVHGVQALPLPDGDAPRGVQCPWAVGWRGPSPASRFPGSFGWGTPLVPRGGVYRRNERHRLD